MTTVLPFARTVSLGERPENKHLVAWHDEQQEAAARNAAVIQAAKPKPPVKPTSVTKLEEQAGLLDGEALQKLNEANAVKAEAVRREHEIYSAKETVKGLEGEVAAIAGVNFKKKSADIKSMLLNSIPAWETSDPLHHVAVYGSLLYLYDSLAGDAAVKLKEKRDALAAAKQHLDALENA